MNINERQHGDVHPRRSDASEIELYPNGVDADGTTAMKFAPSVLWHSLRHFAVSTWIEQGLAPKTVQTYAGHSSVVITLDRYGHLFESDSHKTAMGRIADEFLG